MKKSTESKKVEWGNKFLLTLNKPNITSLLMASPLRDTPCKVVAFKSAVEIGEKGNLHAHYYVVFERSVRKDTLINRYKKDGIEVDRVTPGTEQTVINYVGNLDKEISKGCEILTDYTTTYGNIETTQGQRNDITASDAVLWQIKESIDAGANKRQLYNDFFPYLMRYGKSIFEYLDFTREEETEATRKILVKSAEETAYINEEKEREILEKVYQSVFVN